MVLNNEWVNNEIKEEVKRYQTNENEDITIQKICGTQTKQSQEEIHSITGLSQKARKSSNKQSNFTLKGT